MDWSIILGQQIPVPKVVDQSVHGKLAALLSAFDEILALDDPDAILKRAAELALERIGLKRAGISEDRVRALRHAFRALWRGEELVREAALERIEKGDEATEEVLQLVAFLRRQMRGKHGRGRERTSRRMERGSSS